MEESFIVPTSITDMTSADFSKVLFTGVQRSYSPGTPVSCFYTLTNGIIPNKKDWIGIYKVGWKTVRDYYTFLWSPMPDTDGQEQQILFQAYYLPKEDGEFYQFCYVDNQGVVRGASTPFRFQNISEQETCDDDILVVTTQDKVETFEKEKEALEKEKEELSCQVTELKECCKELEEKKHAAQVENSQLIEDLKHVRQELDEAKQTLSSAAAELNKKVAALEEKTTKQSQENESLRKTLGEHQLTLNNTLTEKKKLEEDMECLKTKIAVGVTEIKRLTEENQKLEEDKKKSNSSCKQAKSELDLLQAETELLKRDIQKLQSEIHNNQKNENELKQTKEQVQRLQEDLSKADRTAQLQELHAKIEKLQQLLKEADMRESQLKSDLRTERDKLKSTEMEYRNKETLLANWKNKFQKLELQHSKCELKIAEVTEACQHAARVADLREMEKKESEDFITRLQAKITDLEKQLSRRHQSPVTSLTPSAGPLTSVPHSQFDAAAQVPVSSLAASDLLFNNPYSPVSGAAAAADLVEETSLCPICAVNFPHLAEFEFHQHVQSHMRDCPYCNREFTEDEEDLFLQHVYSHDQ
ncbi:calcium-binding and coiled-coil domain-containing protein 2 [Protopterus annectens]|uniref:calcium-binding and coiled-coil domain-containing protein 2 n=1 Tax=Protopterus annectens TaxID=7888 RepID=UPI001CF9B77C|nr:calcium-binding and coiled-coil domain-containing protein 2 [Protopterus annectens]